MTLPLFLSTEHSTLLAGQIARLPALRLAPKYRRHRRLAESFELWNLLSCEPLPPGTRLAAVAKFSGLAHHQIRSGKHAVQFALTTKASSAESQPLLQAVFTSDIARKIDRAIEFVDKLPGTDHDRARLLFVPSRHVYALWLYSEQADRIVIASKPNMGRALGYLMVHIPEHFLAVLARRRPVCQRHEQRSIRTPVDVAPP